MTRSVGLDRVKINFAVSDTIQDVGAQPGMENASRTDAQAIVTMEVKQTRLGAIADTTDGTSLQFECLACTGPGAGLISLTLGLTRRCAVAFAIASCAGPCGCRMNVGQHKESGCLRQWKQPHLAVDLVLRHQVGKAAQAHGVV